MQYTPGIRAGFPGKERDAATAKVSVTRCRGIALGPHVLRKDVWEVYDTLQRAAGSTTGQRTLFSAVAGADGRILAATDPVRAPVDADIETLGDGGVAPDALSVDQNAESIKLLAPLVYQGREVGRIVTEMDITDLVAERREARRLLILGNALATGILALFGYVAVRRSTPGMPDG